MPEIINNECIGLIACGGESSRMGQPKYMLDYHGIPQYQFLLRMIQTILPDTFLSFRRPTGDGFPYPVILDAPGIPGPAAAIVSANQQFPGRSILFIGCDYPRIEAGHVKQLLAASAEHHCNAAFFDEDSKKYEPILAVYHPLEMTELTTELSNYNYSLQQWLQNKRTVKCLSTNRRIIESIDDLENYHRVKFGMASSSNLHVND
jgi:molybdenum cofactor guanylyltransferase